MREMTEKEWHKANPFPPGDDPVSSRSGCKVGWRTYATEKRAKEVAAYAMKLGERRAGQGYDFGYCWPGGVRKTDRGFEVTFP